MTEQDEPRSEPGAGTPEGYTAEKPAASELGELGTPGAGMTAAVPHAADAEDGAAHHTTDTHMDSHTSLSDDGHGHGHGDATLGPIDWTAWAYALVGGAAGLVVVVLFWIANN